uniref:mitogen-activated protein kinase kinase kinase 19 n=1 Tax=Doryrhamphus excisus TaxID=161450 RepID=UPI0025AE092A|nr:mitogen-activated protein kinase kinase kinase 19 [Doryrhamphus excisus]XP_057938295.1 mitogen-activated protein kinase kinase kinase 19 [Doryrhamphus excisus]XP_057938296.1 mitogen-activated protein kinase kinase kinase 19 [Doryrhamphus excisus]XP_057938297.1 mitogen-activated protein kinase kinase kinase 19 [Doryrhamphus excisus]
METLTDMVQSYQDAMSGRRRTLPLPSLGNNCRQQSHLDCVPSSRQLTRRSNRHPVPPKHRQRTRSLVEAAPSSLGMRSPAEPTKLSQSAPSILEPLLSSNYVLQARAHIQTRLSSHELISEQKGPILALQPAALLRTPKQLEPLDLRLKDNAAAPPLKHSLPLKPITKSLRSMTHLKRFSWGTPRTDPLPARCDSEDSGSSTSSQSSTDLEDEDYESNIHEDVGRMFTRAKVSKHLKDSEFGDGKDKKIHSTSQLHKSTGIQESVNCQTFINCNNANQNYCIRNRHTVKHETPFLSTSINNGCNQTVKRADPIIQDSLVDKPATAKDSKVGESTYCGTEGAKLNTSSAFEETSLNSNNQRVDLKNAKLKKALKLTQSRAKELNPNCELRTNLSITRLKQKDKSILNLTQAPKDLVHLSLSNQSLENTTGSHDQIVGKEVPVSLVKSNLKSVKVSCWTSDTQSPQKNGAVTAYCTKANPDKVGNPCTRQPPKGREIKSTHQLKSPDVGGTQRSKSVMDFITYNDMFKTIQSEGKGPAIYEMFAGPIYDKLRNPVSFEEKQLQAAHSRKSPEIHKVKPRPLKQVQTKLRRSPTETIVVSTKGKAKPLSSSVKPHLLHAPKDTHRMECISKPEDKVVLTEDVGKNEVPILSTLDEVPTGFKSETLNTDGKCMPMTDNSYSHFYTNMEETALSSTNIRTCTRNTNQTDPEPALSISPQMPRVDTWTSCHSSGHTVMSPVYQKFLDEVGDGPLTDDLLQCLAEELISLDERDVSIVPCPKNCEMELLEGDSPSSRKNENVTSLDLAALHGFRSDDTISWTKGEVLGRGAYGTVYCGLTSQGQLIAVKQVTLDTCDPEAAEREYSRLQGEVELLKTLRHTNIVGFLGTSLHQHMVSIFMEYIPGGSIASILHRFGPLPERVLALYTHQILEGVAYLHFNRVIHRDLKGNNVMLMPTGVIKLIDFGCARRLSFITHTTNSSGDLLKSVHGTPYWMAPEVITETGYGRKSDVWSVGCTVFEMATGKPPLAHMDKIAALFYIGAKQGLMPSLPEGFSESAKDFVNICLTSDQRLRPSADQLLQHSFIPRHRNGVTSWSTQKNNFCDHPDGLCGFV